MDPPPGLLVMFITMSDEWVENVNAICVENFLTTVIVKEIPF